MFARYLLHRAIFLPMGKKIALREYRLKAGMTQEQLAGLAGISKGFLGKMETGRKWPNIDMLIRLAQALNVRPGEMTDALVTKWKAGE